MELYLTEFNYLNNTKFELDDLFCHKCKNVFNATIYSGYIQNICEQCYKSEVTGLKNHLSENVYLRKQLDKSQFPCKYEQCTFRGVLFAYHEHIQTCVFAPMSCPIDEVLCDNASEFIEHFSEHEEVEKRTLGSLSTTVELNLNAMKEKKTVMATFKNQVFIVYLEIWGNSVLFKVGRHADSCISSTPNFSVVYQSENMEIKLKGVIQPFKILFQNENSEKSGVMLKISLLNAKPKVTIYFMDYEHKLNDCPICISPLTESVKQCNNGHSICATCAPKITICPICRSSMNSTFLNLAHVLLQHCFPCENFDQGCGELINFNNKTEHRKICNFKEFVCPDCNSVCTQQTLYSHFKDKHVTSQNFCTQEWILKASPTSKTRYAQSNSGRRVFTARIYIMYRSRVFCLDANYQLDTYQFQFCAKLIGADQDDASMYRYEVAFLKDNDIIARVGNSCDANSQYNSSVTLKQRGSYTTVPKVQKVRAQCIILYNCQSQ